MPVYQYSDLEAEVNGKIRKRFVNLADGRVTLNRAVRKVLSDIDITSMKRKARLSPNLFERVYDYARPVDMGANSIIDVKRQVNRPNTELWNLTTYEEFDRYKRTNRTLIAMSDNDFIPMLHLSGVFNQKDSVIHNLESITGNGTWAASAGASNLALDNENFINGNASLSFDTDLGSLTAVLENSTMNVVDLSDYENKSSIFLWVYIPATSGLTSFTLRWGNDSSNYWSRTVTVNNENTTFYTGWNLLRFDWNGSTETGSVDPTVIDYARITINKTALMAAAVGWRVDYLVARIGDIYDVIYHSKYGWQTSAGVYIENSTTDTDYLNVDTDEFDLFTDKAAEIASQELEDYDAVKVYHDDYEANKKNYQMNNPSERKILENIYYLFGTVEGVNTSNDPFIR